MKDRAFLDSNILVYSLLQNNSNDKHDRILSFSEDFQDGLLINGKLVVENPFVIERGKL